MYFGRLELAFKPCGGATSLGEHSAGRQVGQLLMPKANRMRGLVSCRMGRRDA